VKRRVALSLGALGDFLLTLPLLRELRPVGLLSRAVYRVLLPGWLENTAFLPIDGALGTRLFTPDAVFPTQLADLVAGAEIHVFSRPDGLLERNLNRHGAGRLVRLVWHDPRPTAPPHVVARYFADAGLVLPSDWLTTPAMPVAEIGDSLWIHAGSGSPAKTLPIALLVRHAQDWQQETGQPVIISYGEADLALRQPVQQAMATAGIPVEEVVCPTLGELRAQLARRARRFLGADTGVTHLAAALGKEVHVGFRATDPAIWQPLGRCQVFALPR